MTEHFEWVLRIIDSCQHPFHLDCAKELIKLFHLRYGDVVEYEKLLERYVAKEPMIIV